MKIEAIKTRVNELIHLANCVMASTTEITRSGRAIMSTDKFSELRSASLSFIKSTFGSDHPFYNEFDKKVIDSDTVDVSHGLGILKAVKQELDGGWVFTVKGLVSAEIFSDFLEMSDYLLAENYKDAAAVMTGSVLEEHLRQLCRKKGISVEIIKDGKPIPKKADLLNSELSNSDVYNKLDQKSITSWLDLRNKAAHGKYEEYSKEQVAIMYQGVINFINRTT